jgi:hypothetical protein
MIFIVYFVGLIGFARSGLGGSYLGPHGACNTTKRISARLFPEAALASVLYNTIRHERILTACIMGVLGQRDLEP